MKPRDGRCCLQYSPTRFVEFKGSGIDIGSMVFPSIWPFGVRSPARAVSRPVPV